MPGVLQRGGEGEASGAAVIQGFHPVRRPACPRRPRPVR